MDQPSMPDVWQRFEAWLQANAPALRESLQPGATGEQIAQAEAALSVQFPDDFKAAYQAHNGQTAHPQSGLIAGREWLSLERIQEEWTIWKDLLDSGDFDDDASEPEGPIRTDWWNAQWIPITYDGAGNHDCLDLAPADGGHVGQVIDFWHDDSFRAVQAPSFGAWLVAFVEGCETGAYVYSAEAGGIVDAEDV